MDCSCGCLARMVPIAEACVYYEGVELTECQRCNQLSCLLIPNHGFQKLPSTIRFVAPSSGKLILETVHKNGYQYMQADNHIDSDGCINIIVGWKEFVFENGFEVREVVMVMFYREKGSLMFRISTL